MASKKQVKKIKLSDNQRFTIWLAALVALLPIGPQLIVQGLIKLVETDPFFSLKGLEYIVLVICGLILTGIMVKEVFKIIQK